MKIDNKIDTKEDDIDSDAPTSIKQEIHEMVDGFFDALDNVWDAPEETKQQEYKKMKRLIQFQLVLSCPAPAVSSMMERDIEQINGTRVSKDRCVYLTPALWRKYEIVAKHNKTTVNDVALVDLSEGINKHLKPEKDKPSSLLPGSTW